MNYVLDTSALNRAWNEWYRLEQFPDIWNGLEELAANSHLTIPDAVLEELKEQNSDLYHWCNDRREILEHISNEPVQAVIREIEANFPGLKNASMPKKTNFADPFVIATAHHLNASVISNEEPTGLSRSGMKIPDVCRQMGVRHWMFHRIVRDQGWTFRISN